MPEGDLVTELKNGGDNKSRVDESEAPERPGIGARIKSIFRGFGARNGEVGKEKRSGDLVNIYDGLLNAHEAERSSSNLEISEAHTAKIAGTLINHPGFKALFPNVDSIILGENREVKSSTHKEGDEEHKSLSIEEMKDVINSERERLGNNKVKALV